MRKYSESGNALFLILIAVVLFAALSYAITQSNRGSGNANKEITSLAASSILQAASSYATAHTRMQLRGIPTDSYSGISFVGPAWPQYGWNEEMQRRNILHPDGGGASLIIPSKDWVEVFIPVTDVDTTSNWAYQISKQIRGVGTDTPENVLILRDVKKSICQRLNYMLAGNEKIPTINRNDNEFRMNGNDLWDAEELTLGRSAYCIRPGDKDVYHFYQVLGEDGGSH